jgi:hypothetical protein
MGTFQHFLGEQQPHIGLALLIIMIELYLFGHFTTFIISESTAFRYLASTKNIG